MVVPPGLSHLVLRYPALKRGLSWVVPSGLGLTHPKVRGDRMGPVFKCEIHACKLATASRVPLRAPSSQPAILSTRHAGFGCPAHLRRRSSLLSDCRGLP